MGTVVSFHVDADKLGPARASAAVHAACARLHELDAIFSTWRPDSPMSLLRRGTLSLGEVPSEVAVVLGLCRSVKRLSKSWFDPWAMPGGVDPTGLVKGWAIAEAMGVLASAGIDSAMVNGGGDVAVIGSPPEGSRWRIGIRHPWRSDSFARVLEVDSAIATSGAYEREGQLLDPRDGTVAVGIASATVTGPSLAVCDGLATALAVGGDEVLGAFASLDDYEGYVIFADGSERESCAHSSAIAR